MSDPLEADLAYRYDTRPRLAPTERDAFAPPESFVNYWDMNPVAHGGRFLKWTGSDWVAHLSEPMDEYDEGATVDWFRYTVSPDDIWVDPDDPLTDFTDDMKAVLRSLTDTHRLPNGDGFLGAITYYAADRRFQPPIHYGYDTTVVAEDYWDEAEARGIDPDAERGWRLEN
jgi:hypothetical protein